MCPCGVCANLVQHMKYLCAHTVHTAVRTCSRTLLPTNKSTRARIHTNKNNNRKHVFPDSVRVPGGCTATNNMQYFNVRMDAKSGRWVVPQAGRRTTTTTTTTANSGKQPHSSGVATGQCPHVSAHVLRVRRRDATFDHDVIALWLCCVSWLTEIAHWMFGWWLLADRHATTATRRFRHR